MDSNNPASTNDDEVEELTRINQQLGVPPDAARSVAEDEATRGPRKPSSDEVEQERIDRARAEEGG